MQNVGKTLKDLGWGIEQFSDYLNDGEGDDIKEFFKDAGYSFTKFIGSLGKLGEVGDIDIFSQLTSLSDSIGTVNLESVTKLDTFTTGVVNAMNAFAGIQDPAVEALSAVTGELYMLCNAIEKLDVEKLNGLENINLGGVQTPIKIPARKTDQTVIEGVIGGGMMVEQADLPVIDVSGGTLPPSDPFATPGPSLAEVFASPPAQSQVQEVTDTGSMSLAEAFASPPQEMVTTILPLEASANVTGEIVNQLSQPIVAIAGSLYLPTLFER